MIHFHTTLASVNGYKVRILLSILDLKWEHVDVDMYGMEHKKEPFLSLNPYGQMPAMEAHLGSNEWLAASLPTIADISCFAPISFLPNSGYKTDKWAKVTAWLDHVCAIPGAIDADGNAFS